MRALIRPVSIHAASQPIETIVFFFIVATLAYFHVLSAIKHSSFLAPNSPSTLRPAHTLLRDGKWVSVSENTWYDARHSENGVTTLELQQIVLSLDAKAAKKVPPRYCSHLKLSDRYSLQNLPHVQSSMDNVTQYLTHRFVSSSGKSYSDLCHQLTVDGSAAQCFVSTVPDSPTSEVLTLSFIPGGREEFLSAFKKQAPFASEELGSVKYVIEDQEAQTIGDMKSGKWVAYAARAMVVRFWDLLKKADSLDILLVLAGYILMHTTFIRLFLSSRSLGSNFWLMTAILSSSILSFIVALPLAGYLHIPLEPVSLIEALPFLVCTVGFDKPLRLARAVFSHPHLFTPAVQEGRFRGQMKPAPELIMEALDKAANPILRDYALEIAVLLIGAYSKVGGLKEFCALAALLLTVDCVAMATFYCAILSIMIEVRRIKMFRNMSRSGPKSADGKPATVLSNGQLQMPQLNFRQRTSAAVLGVKGSFLRQTQGTDGKVKDTKEESPVARLKLLLVR